MIIRFLYLFLIIAITNILKGFETKVYLLYKNHHFKADLDSFKGAISLKYFFQKYSFICKAKMEYIVHLKNNIFQIISVLLHFRYACLIKRITFLHNFPK